MDSDEMIRRMKNGEPVIDVAIDKWKDIANGNGHCFGPSNCSLCRLYIREKCDNCQIYKFNGCRYCVNTPYVDWYKHYMEVHFGVEDSDTLSCAICKKIANEEVAFLEKVKSKAFLYTSL